MRSRGARRRPAALVRWPLAVHVARHRRIGWGAEIRISQGAEIKRPSTASSRADGSNERIDRVEVGGSAVALGAVG